MTGPETKAAVAWLTSAAPDPARAGGNGSATREESSSSPPAGAGTS